MKKSILLITALALSSVSFAQKKELKDVKKAIDRNNLTEAEQLLRIWLSLVRKPLLNIIF